jgi:hypothetical protein
MGTLSGEKVVKSDPSAELSRRIEKVVGYPPLSEPLPELYAPGLGGLAKTSGESLAISARGLALRAALIGVVLF